MGYTSWAKNQSPEVEIAAGVGEIALIPLPPGTDPTDAIGAGMIADGVRRRHEQRRAKSSVKKKKSVQHGRR